MTLPKALVACAAMLFVWIPERAHAQAGKEFTTSGGATLVLLPIAGMECDEMMMMLNRIDATRYRENAPQPHDDADTPLFEYELQLAESYFMICVQRAPESPRSYQMLRLAPE